MKRIRLRVFFLILSIFLIFGLIYFLFFSNKKIFTSCLSSYIGYSAYMTEKEKIAFAVPRLISFGAYCQNSILHDFSGREIRFATRFGCSGGMPMNDELEAKRRAEEKKAMESLKKIYTVIEFPCYGASLPQ